MVIRSLHETLQYAIVSPNPKDIKTVLDVMTSLSTLDEPVLRTDLMEQVPQIAFLCHDNPEKLGGLVTGNLVPMVVKFLTDQNDLVRKTSQAALLVLLEQELVSHKDVHDQVCPVILDLTESDANDVFKTEAVALMSKMAPLVGREMTEKVFMKRFTRLCSDTLFQVRKVCAANFGEFCGVVGTHCAETVLFPYFLNLCEDGVWGVRKACADAFMVVSCACSLETRKWRLSSLFVSLLSDDSRWVRLAAFQNLGPFISTFADPSVTGLHYNDQGILFIGAPPEHSEQAQPLNADNIVNAESQNVECDSNKDELPEENSERKKCGIRYRDSPKGFIFRRAGSRIRRKEKARLELNDINENLGIQFDSSPFCVSDLHSSFNPLDPASEVRQPGFKSLYDDPSYNEINFWRIPLPDLDLSSIASDCELIVEQQFTECEHLSFSEESVESSPSDEVQTELEALAASLAEPTFCNDSDSESRPAQEKETDSSVDESSEKSDPARCENFEEFYSFFKNTEPEKPKPTYAEVCATMGPSQTQSTAQKDLEGEESPPDTAVESCSSSDVTSPESEDLDDPETNTTTPPEPSEESGDPLGKIDTSKIVFHSRSFYYDEEGSAAARRKYNNDILATNEALNYKESQKMFRISVNIKQDIVPKTLLEHYISMTDPLQAETVDDEITRHCAYSLPAVALTLGRQYWSVLRKTYEILARDMHWKVRRTLAFSIHELALILGEELAEKDLLPVFEGFIKDLDEVRIGVLKHLAPFLKMLPQEQRELFLPRLSEFLNPDNGNNWRFRLELALQLTPISDLFSAQECWTHICPITFDLMADKVVEIRRTCYEVISQLARQLMTGEKDSYIVPFSEKLVEQFAEANTWTKRQSYVYVVGQIIKDFSLPFPVVCSLFLPNFLKLSNDKVPNIRLVIGKIINSAILTNDYFHSPEVESSIRVKETLLKLQNDEDKDVQYFASFTITDVSTETHDSSFY